MSVYLAIIKKRGLDTRTALLQFILPISHLPSTAKSGGVLTISRSLSVNLYQDGTNAVKCSSLIINQLSFPLSLFMRPLKNPFE